MAKIPESLKPHQVDYKQGAWEDYEIFELGFWIHLFMKRAEHRTNPEKRLKDLTDAQNYLDIIQAKLASLKGA